MYLNKDGKAVVRTPAEWFREELRKLWPEYPKGVHRFDVEPLRNELIERFDKEAMYYGHADPWGAYVRSSWSDMLKADGIRQTQILTSRVDEKGDIVQTEVNRIDTELEMEWDNFQLKIQQDQDRYGYDRKSAQTRVAKWCEHRAMTFEQTLEVLRQLNLA